jgi:hypothetical protein
MRTKGDRQKASMQNPVNAPQQARITSNHTEKGGDEMNSRAVASDSIAWTATK